MQCNIKGGTPIYRVTVVYKRFSLGGPFFPQNRPRALRNSYILGGVWGYLGGILGGFQGVKLQEIEENHPKNPKTRFSRVPLFNWEFPYSPFMARIFGIRPERGRDGRDGPRRTTRDGRTDEKSFERPYFSNKN